MKVNLLGVLAESNAPGNSAKLWDMVYGLPSAAFAVKGEDGKWGGNSTWAGTVNPVAQSQDAGYSRNHNRGIYTDLTYPPGTPCGIEGSGCSRTASLTTISPTSTRIIARHTYMEVLR